MSQAISVSVVVPVLNGADTLGDTLSALVHQSGAPSQTEILVVDNGSKDGTPDLVRRFPVTLLCESKRGPAAARNRGLNQARGEVVAFLDADTLPTRRWLSSITAPFADPHVMLVSGERHDYIAHTPSERFMAQMGVYALEYNIFSKGLPHVSSSNMAVRRSAALALNGFDEDFLTAEDFDFTLRLVRRFPASISREPDAVLFSRHRVTADALGRQAWGYGEGLGRIHLRYPEIGAMNFSRRLALARVQSLRRIKSLVVPRVTRFRWTTPAQAEFAEYHWLWSQWFWRGYFSMLRYQEWRDP